MRNSSTFFALFIVSAGMVFSASTAAAAVKTKTLSYTAGGAKLQGFLAWDDAKAKGKKLPGVLVVHEWWGLNDYARMRAKMLAELGYVAFAVDMYGEGKSTTHPEDANKMMKAVLEKSGAAAERFAAGLDVLKKNPNVDPARLAAIGYCFGGSTVLEAARRGVDISGVVSFHGSLGASGEKAKAGTKPKILVCHGADDPMIPAEQVKAFEDEMKAAGADYKLVAYAGAKHSFTNPGADKVGIEGIAYNKEADEKSWAAMKAFFETLFAK